jgi:protein-tyrosine phosphatase
MTRLTQISAWALISALAACSQDAPPVAEGAVAGTRSAAPASETAKVTAADVTFEAGTYEISWTLDGDASVDVSVTASRANSAGTLIAEDVSAANFTWTPDGGEPERRYFTVQPQGGEPVMAATRVLPLEGGRNFRDLGGYVTAEGRRVKWGRVFRSGVMHDLTPADYDYLSGLGIDVICDFRAASERESEPTEWAAGEIDYVTFPDPASDDDLSKSFAAVFQDPDVTPETVRAAFIENYRAMHKIYAPAYSAMFDELANGDIPLAFNCSAGKDRTGVAAALLLTTLGVPRETVVADYALSEQVVDYMAEFYEAAEEAGPDSPYAFLTQLPPEVVEPLMRTEPAYIEATFDAIETEYGSVEAYLDEVLDVDASELERLRERLLD